MSFSHPLWWLLQVLFCYWKTGFMLRCWAGFGKRNKKSLFSFLGRIPHHHPHLEWKTETENGTKRWKHFWLCLLKCFRLIQCLSNKNHTKHMHKRRLSYCALLCQQSFFQKLLLYWTAFSGARALGRSSWTWGGWCSVEKLLKEGLERDFYESSKHILPVEHLCTNSYLTKMQCSPGARSGRGSRRL